MSASSLVVASESKPPRSKLLLENAVLCSQILVEGPAHTGLFSCALGHFVIRYLCDISSSCSADEPGWQCYAHGPQLASRTKGYRRGRRSGLTAVCGR